ncbi:hypothetical protein MTP04_22590 [Lysinibacillus sp. PLM2]|nr:hypothetical protein MTP04_22590 [Lysinibacillus sp. PLM2]
MTYVYKRGDNVPKTIPFVKTFDGTFSGGIGKGTPIEIKGKKYEVVSIRRIEFGNRLFKVIGKARAVSD